MTERPRSAFTSALFALIGGQVALHSCMAGIRMAAPLAALRDGHAAWAVGVLLGLFAAAPVVLALAAGRLADRHGYPVPIRVAVALTVVGGICAVIATAIPTGQFIGLCVAALLTGAGTSFGLIAIQRSAGRMANGSTDLKRIFSWLGLAPALANVVGPVVAGTLIDLAGFQLAFAVLTALPLASLVWARFVPVEARAQGAATERRPNSWDLLGEPGFTRLLFVNWLLASSWDVHTFLVPILGHERGFSASAIGLILGVFAIAVATVRLVIPLLAHRLRESHVLVGAMLICAAVFAIYPLAQTAWVMGCCAVALGLALGAVQPMVMTTLHQITPPARHGEAIALRSMAINLSSAVMPLAFGLAGATLGASALFWLMGAAVGSGSLAARHIDAAKPALH
jgi:MFS family permease